MDILLAVIGGMLGVILGIMPSFIFFGAVGIAGCVVDNTFLQTTMLNGVFHPAITMTGGVAALSYASSRMKYKIQGNHGTKSLWSACSLKLYLLGAISGLLGYAIMYWATVWRVPIDTGAFSIVVMAVLIRRYVGKGTLLSYKKIYRAGVRRYLKLDLVNETVMPAVIGVLCALVVMETGNMFVCFYISALTLILVQMDPSFPATHHVTLVSSYAAFVYQGLGFETMMIIVIICAIFAQIIFEVSNIFLNYGFGYDPSGNTIYAKSHIDPPATAIAIMSFIIFGIGRIFGMY